MYDEDSSSTSSDEETKDKAPVKKRGLANPLVYRKIGLQVIEKVRERCEQARENVSALED